ncbi:hypothetical protein FNH09_05180 [Streptomyces adustus]|uniref:Uncharacterized protein n=1 Tax=Streptomyces adustus TaxID=1609272 RepID=A0A5N8V9N6_9ACTN|nr:hypothetical protein [Streptomyces adustus]MPY30728.1 hypothetical protein [Streptomyces adustus]
MAADGDTAKVDNPERERLKELKRDLQREHATLVGALKQAEKDIGNGGRDSAKSWVGKNADNWHREVAGHRKVVRTRIDKVLEDIQREIDSMPEKVTSEEATSMNRNRRMS